MNVSAINGIKCWPFAILRNNVTWYVGMRWDDKTHPLV